MAAHRQKQPHTRDTPDADDCDLAAEVVDQTLRLAAHLRGRVHDALALAGVNESRFAVLRHVASRGESGCSQVELAEAMGQCESSICTLVDRMKSDELIVRLRCTVDRRKSRLHLTDNGTVALAAATSQFSGVAQSLAQLWGQSALTPMRSLLETMLFEMERPSAAASTSDRKAA